MASKKVFVPCVETISRLVLAGETVYPQGYPPEVVMYVQVCIREAFGEEFAEKAFYAGLEKAGFGPSDIKRIDAYGSVKNLSAITDLVHDVIDRRSHNDGE